MRSPDRDRFGFVEELEELIFTGVINVDLITPADVKAEPAASAREDAALLPLDEFFLDVSELIFVGAVRVDEHGGAASPRPGPARVGESSTRVKLHVPGPELLGASERPTLRPGWDVPQPATRAQLTEPGLTERAGAQARSTLRFISAEEIARDWQQPPRPSPPPRPSLLETLLARWAVVVAALLGAASCGDSAAVLSTAEAQRDVPSAPLTREEVERFYQAPERRGGVLSPFLIRLDEAALEHVAQDELLLRRHALERVPIEGAVIAFEGGRAKSAQPFFRTSLGVESVEGGDLVRVHTRPAGLDELVVRASFGEPYPARVGLPEGGEVRRQALGEDNLLGEVLRSRLLEPLSAKLSRASSRRGALLRPDGVELSFGGVLDPAEDALELSFVDDDPLTVTRGELVDDVAFYFYAPATSPLRRMERCDEMPVRIARAKQEMPSCYARYWTTLGEEALGVPPSPDVFARSDGRFYCDGLGLPSRAEVQAWSRQCRPRWRGDFTIRLSGIRARLKLDRVGLSMGLTQMVTPGGRKVSSAAEVEILPGVEVKAPFFIPVAPALAIPGTVGVRFLPLSLVPGQDYGADLGAGLALDLSLEQLEVTIETSPIILAYDPDQEGFVRTNTSASDFELVTGSMSYDGPHIQGSIAGGYKAYLGKVEPFIKVLNVEASIMAALLAKLDGKLGIARTPQGKIQPAGSLCASLGVGVEANLGADLPLTENDPNLNLALFSCDVGPDALCLFNECLELDLEGGVERHDVQQLNPKVFENNAPIQIKASWPEALAADFDLSVERVLDDGSTELLCRYGSARCEGADQHVTRKRSGGAGCPDDLCEESLTLTEGITPGRYRVTVREHAAPSHAAPRHPGVHISHALACESIPYGLESFEFDVVPGVETSHREDGSTVREITGTLNGHGSAALREITREPGMEYVVELHAGPERVCDLDLYGHYRQPPRRGGEYHLASHEFGPTSERIEFVASEAGPYWLLVYSDTEQPCPFTLTITSRPSPRAARAPLPVDGFDFPVGEGGLASFPISLGFLGHNSYLDLAGHCGVDLVPRERLLVGHHGLYSIAHGVVTFAGVPRRPEGIGNIIVIEHDLPGHPEFEKLESVYYHAWSVNVRVGDVVRRGDLIGTLGDGRTLEHELIGYDVEHLHFELRSAVGRAPDFMRGYNCAVGEGFLDPIEFIQAHRTWRPAPAPREGSAGQGRGGGGGSAW